MQHCIIPPSFQLYAQKICVWEPMRWEIHNSCSTVIIVRIFVEFGCSRKWRPFPSQFPATKTRDVFQTKIHSDNEQKTSIKFFHYDRAIDKKGQIRAVWKVFGRIYAEQGIKFPVQWIVHFISIIDSCALKFVFFLFLKIKRTLLCLFAKVLCRSQYKLRYTILIHCHWEQ